MASDPAEPLVHVGDTICMPEADYCYGRGLLTIRATEVDGISPASLDSNGYGFAES